MKLVAAAALAAVIVILAVNLLVWHAQERIVFQPAPPPYPDDRGWSREVYTASDGQELFAYVLGDRARATDALIVFHGNADLAVRQLSWADQLARRVGILVVVPEYRGYGGLGGTPSYEGSRRDAEASYVMVRDRLGVAPTNIMLFGHSLGTAIATELAAAVRPRALVLLSPFTSVRAMGAYLITPRVPAIWKLLARIHWDTEARVAQLDVPVWIAHGTRDGVIPVRMGRVVYAAAKHKGELLVVPGAAHNDVPDVGGDDYERWLAAAVGHGRGPR